MAFGINLGPNLGSACWHSGTLAAAKQGALLGSRGIALSTHVEELEPDFAELRPWLVKALEVVIPLRDLSLVNINVPPRARGLRWTRQSVRHYDGKVVPDTDPYGRPLHWITVVPIEATEEGTDRWAVNAGYVSLTPLRLDLTDAEGLARVNRPR